MQCSLQITRKPLINAIFLLFVKLHLQMRFQIYKDYLYNWLRVITAKCNVGKYITAI